MPKPRGEGRHPKSERASGFSFCATTDGRPISRPNGKEAGRRSPKLNYVLYVATAAKNERERERDTSLGGLQCEKEAADDSGAAEKTMKGS